MNSSRFVYVVLLLSCMPLGAMQRALAMGFKTGVRAHMPRRGYIKNNDCTCRLPYEHITECKTDNSDAWYDYTDATGRLDRAIVDFKRAHIDVTELKVVQNNLCKNAARCAKPGVDLDEKYLRNRMRNVAIGACIPAVIFTTIGYEDWSAWLVCVAMPFYILYGLASGHYIMRTPVNKNSSLNHHLVHETDRVNKALEKCARDMANGRISGYKGCNTGS